MKAFFLYISWSRLDRPVYKHDKREPLPLNPQIKPVCSSVRARSRLYSVTSTSAFLHVSSVSQHFSLNSLHVTMHAWFICISSGNRRNSTWIVYKNVAEFNIERLKAEMCLPHAVNSRKLKAMGRVEIHT